MFGDMDPILVWLIVAGIIVFILFGILSLFNRFYRKVNQGEALIINKMSGEPLVKFTGGLVLPVVHRAEVMDISVKTIDIDRRGNEGLICKDNIRADIKVTFFVRVNKTQDDVLKVAQNIGCQRASDHRTLEELFIAKFAEALKTVGKQLDFVDLYTQRDDFKDQIVQVIGRDLNGYVLEDAAIDFLEQTPVTSLDKDNILDAQGIRKITELTAIQHVKTNEFRNQEMKLVRKQDVEAAEVILNLDRQKADAEARQHREIATVRSRESAEAAKVAAEEKQRSEEARIKAEEALAIQEENKARQVEIARKSKERAVLVESERVEKERALEAIQRERETELQRISMHKELEVQKKEIQDVIRERIAVEKTVAEEEEAIKTLRTVEDAKRAKEAAVVTAEGQAQEKLVKDIKAAEAAEQAAKHRAREKLTLADAQLEASDREAKAKIRLAEGVKAESAAKGLAAAQVKEAEAAAAEKIGFAQARVTKEKLVAQAQGEEAQGLARVKVLEAEADANEKRGLVDAKVLQEKGTAEGEAKKQQLLGESAGLAEKAKSMKLLDEAGRGHEEFRLKIEAAKALQMEGIHARQAVAEAQARLLGEAFKQAKIDIVGGDQAFIERVTNAVSYGKAVDGAIDHGEALGTALSPYTSGDRSLVEDITDVLKTTSTEDIRNLTLSGFLARMASSGDGSQQKNLRKLAEAARQLGVHDLEVK